MQTVLDASISYIQDNNLRDYRDLVLDYRKPVHHPRGTMLSICGSPVDCLYFLAEGLVRISTSNIHGYHRIIGFHKENTLFAMDHLEKGNLAVVNSKCITAVQVVPLCEEDLLILNQQDPSLMPALLRYYGTVLRLMCFDAENQSITDTATRLANFFCIYQRSQEFQSSGHIAMSQEELASAVNASRVQIARICSDWRKQGWIDVAFRKICIRDWQGILAFIHA